MPNWPMSYIRKRRYSRTCPSILTLNYEQSDNQLLGSLLHCSTFYALRWVTCLFALEFALPDLVQIWDTFFALLSDSNGSNGTARTPTLDNSESQARSFLLDVCCSMILFKRYELLTANVSPNTKEKFIC